jgi:hypothetical protein
VREELAPEAILELAGDADNGSAVEESEPAARRRQPQNAAYPWLAAVIATSSSMALSDQRR